MKKLIALIVGLAAFFGLLAAPASAAVRPAPPKKVAISAALIKKVCATKGRDNALYWRYCMRNGTIEYAAQYWFIGTPLGFNGKESPEDWNRRSICRYGYLY